MKKLKRYLVRIDSHYYVTIEGTSKKSVLDEVHDLYCDGDLILQANDEWKLTEEPELNVKYWWNSSVELVPTIRGETEK